MMRTSVTILSGLCSALGVLLAVPSYATGAPCPSLLVEAEAAVQVRWPDLGDQIRAAFDGRRDVDGCATVHLRLSSDAIALDVSLPDGRSAARLARPEDVVSGLEALLLVPESASPTRATTPAQPSATTRFEPTAIEAHADRQRAAADDLSASATAVSPPSRLRVELSMNLGMHRGDGQTRTSIGASSLLDLSGWLVGFSGHVDRYEGATATTGDAPKALEVGLLTGRRFRSRAVALDVIGGPAFALRGSWAVAMVNTMSSGTAVATMSRTSHQDLVPRLVLGGRLTLGARSNVRTFLGIDGEAGEAGPLPPGTARGLPLWMVGVSVGATVGTL